MVKIEFYISDEDFDLLYELKEKYNKNDLTGNEFAKLLLKSKITELLENINYFKNSIEIDKAINEFYNNLKKAEVLDE